MTEPTAEQPNLKVVIFCGGFGTRWWPLSRQNAPKQFQPIIEGKSLFEITLKRVEKGFAKENIFFSVPEFQLKYLQKLVKNYPPESFIVEPERRDTLGAVGYVSAYLEHFYPGSLIAAVWSDHLIKQEDEFLRLLKSAAEFCSENNVFIKIGERPEYASTVHGWILPGDDLGKIGGHPYFDFKGHIEKPVVDKAEELFRQNKALISTGYFVAKSSQILDFFKNYAPEDYQPLEKIMAALDLSLIHI